MEMPQLPDCITLTRDKGLAIVTLDRGSYGGGMNPLSAEAMAGLRDVARWLKTDIETHCIILTGARVFSIGADLKDKNMQTHNLDSLTQRQQLLLGPDMCAAWEAVEQVTICAMERYAIGGALALAVSCDWRVASDDCDIRLPEVPLGINMSWQANPRITVLVGPSRAKQLVILGENIGAQTAADWGLVDVVPSSGGTLAAAQELAQRVVALPPLPVRRSMQAISAQANALEHLSSFMGRELCALLTGSDDNKAAVRAVMGKSKK